MDVSGLEDEYLLSGTRPKLVYVKRPAPEREGRLDDMLDRIRSSDEVSYKSFSDTDELERLVADDLAFLVSEAFITNTGTEVPRRARLRLPTDVSTFVGRAGELEQLESLLRRDDVRLVTLTGPGGIGKTRLALRVAAELAPTSTKARRSSRWHLLAMPISCPARSPTRSGCATCAPKRRSTRLKSDLAERSLIARLGQLRAPARGRRHAPELLGAAPRSRCC